MIAALSLSLACLATESSAGFQIGETYWSNTGQTFTGVSVPASCTIYSRVQANSYFYFNGNYFVGGYVQSVVIVSGPNGLVHQLSVFATPDNPHQSDERFAFNQPAGFYAVYHIVSLSNPAGDARTLTTLTW